MKTITLGNRQVELTPEYIRRINESIADTKRVLLKQLSYPEDLIFDEHKKLIWDYAKHLAKLEEMLSC